MFEDKTDFIAKLRQIEELANEVHAELPAHVLMLKTRIQHVLVLARTLRGRLEFGAVSIIRVEPDPDATKPPA